MATDLIHFFDHTRSELAETLQERFGFPSYRAQQLFAWVYQKLVFNPEQMTNIGKDHRAQLGAIFSFPDLDYIDRQLSKDGTRKYLFSVTKGHQVESVMIKQPARMTLCVSSQVGCALGCKFCQTGTMGLIRHLSLGEIIQQVVGVISDARNFDDMFSNVVFMGMGEPFHNFDNVRRAISVMTDDYGIGLSARRITVSTVGLVPQIERFFKEKVEANLAVSLNATTNEVRSEIMPINQRFPLEQLLATLRSATLRPRQRITIEYVMLAGINDSDADLQRLPKILNGIPVKVNLIPYNDNAGLGFKSPTEEKAYRWQRELNDRGVLATIRWSKGKDIDAACGQLVTSSSRKKRETLTAISA